MGLDPTIIQLSDLYPKNGEGIRQFCLDIIEATQFQSIAYKINMAFFEIFGKDFWKLYTDVRSAIPPNIPLILDAKRGDIGHSSEYLAKYVFETCEADAVTVHPYMGFDSIEPFLKYTDKFTFILGHTSNIGSQDFQCLKLADGSTLAAHMIHQADKWRHQYKNVGVVIGATQQTICDYRSKHPDLLFLMPGVGKQGAKYSESYHNGKNTDQIALINASRAISENTKSCKTREDFIVRCQENVQTLLNC